MSLRNKYPQSIHGDLNNLNDVNSLSKENFETLHLLPSHTINYSPFLKKKKVDDSEYIHELVKANSSLPVKLARVLERQKCSNV